MQRGHLLALLRGCIRWPRDKGSGDYDGRGENEGFHDRAPVGRALMAGIVAEPQAAEVTDQVSTDPGCRARRRGQSPLDAELDRCDYEDDKLGDDELALGPVYIHRVQQHDGDDVDHRREAGIVLSVARGDASKRLDRAEEFSIRWRHLYFSASCAGCPVVPRAAE